MKKRESTPNNAVRRLSFWLTFHGLCALLCACVSLDAQEPTSHLHWRNGDSLPGRLLESKGNQIRWKAPIFADELVVDSSVLESVVFPRRTEAPSMSEDGAFRITTTSGDVFHADLVGANSETLNFSNRKFGKFAVRRTAVYSLDRRDNPNLAFDGSQFKDWGLDYEGPIKDMTFSVYQGNWKWGDAPDWSELKPERTGRLAAGFLDIGLARKRERFGMTFEGRLEVDQAGQYQFEVTADDRAIFYIDGKQHLDSRNVGQRSGFGVKLTAGSHTIRVEFVDFGGEAYLDVWWSGPGFHSTPLSSDHTASLWQRGPGGHPMTDRAKSSIFRKVTLPKQFEVDLEFTASVAPRFVLAIAADEVIAETSQALRLETWDDELVVVQDKVFEPVMTIGKGQRNVRLRVAYDGETNRLRVSDANGRTLVQVEGIRATTGESGIYIRNRGNDLTVRRLAIRRQVNGRPQQPIDYKRQRVHLLGGEVEYGRLFIEEGRAFVMDAENQRTDIDLNQLDRIATPDVKLAVTSEASELHYVDGAVIRGRIEQTNSSQVTLQTTFSDVPVVCALAGASSLRFDLQNKVDAQVDVLRILSKNPLDEMRFVAGRLRGHLWFDSANWPLSWKPQGVERPLRLSIAGGALVERSSQNVKAGLSFDSDAFPHVMHLNNGEMIPCRVLSYDEESLDFQSPFLQTRSLKSSHLKAIEFNVESLEARSTNERSGIAATSSALRALIIDQLLSVGSTANKLMVDPAKLERALTVPRFNRDSPPSHILVANSGDLKRGSLLTIKGQGLQFESKLRKFSVPIDRISRVVSVSKPPEEAAGHNAKSDNSSVRVKLSDGCLLIFEPVRFQDGKLHGRSAIYGDVRIPVDNLLELQLGDFNGDKFKSLFEDWQVRPAKEPHFAQ